MAARSNYDWTGGAEGMRANVPGTPGWWLDRLARRLISRSTGPMVTYARYYSGDHYQGPRGSSFIGDRLGFLLGPQFKRMCVNYCEAIVDTLVERLEVTGFQTAGEPRANDDLWRIWQRNSLDQDFAKGLREGAIKGEFSMALWQDKAGKAQMRVQDPLQVIVATDPEDRRVRRAALKRWFDEDMGLWYATLYLPKSIWKFQAETTPTVGQDPSWWEGDYWTQTNPWLTWQPRVMAGDEPYMFANPFGEVPIVPFPNKPNLAGQGVSELHNIVPLQDAVNKLNFDLLMASEYAAFPQKWATNVDLELDENTGKVKSPWEIGVDRIFMAGPPAGGDNAAETKFGQFDPADLQNWINALEAKLKEIATVSRTPPHYLNGSSGIFPSGESLRAAETGLVNKALDRQRDDAEPLELAMRLAAKIEGLADLAGADELATLWADPETRTESEHLAALVQMATLGVPRKGLWARIPGATPTEIAKWEALIAAGDVVTGPTAPTTPAPATDPAAAPTSNPQAA